MATARAAWYGTAMRIAACVCVLVAAMAARATADTDWVRIDRVVAVVNHDIILGSELERELGTVPELASITDDAARAKRRDELRPLVLDDLIERALYRQQAARAGVTVDDAEVSAAVEEVKRQNQLDDKTFAEALSQSGFTVDQYRANVKDQIIRIKVVNVAIRPQVGIDEATIKAEYDKLKAGTSGSAVKPYNEVKDQLREQLIAQRLDVEAAKVVAAWRADGYVDVRLP
jgi:parvulin-like peptidyl-prolyl isomerase